jgi:hypothetical protein
MLSLSLTHAIILAKAAFLGIATPMVFGGRSSEREDVASKQLQQHVIRRERTREIFSRARFQIGGVGASKSWDSMAEWDINEIGIENGWKGKD